MSNNYTTTENHYAFVTDDLTDDLTDGEVKFNAGTWKAIEKDLFKFHEILEKQKGETMYYLWQVFLVYGKGDTCSPCMPKYVIAKDSEEAKIKSGVYKDIPDSWDSEYVTILCLTLGEVKVPKNKT